MAGTTRFRVVAQDPVVRALDGRILTTVISVPSEQLDEGPRGYRVAVIDYDGSADKLYLPWKPVPGLALDADAPDADILEDPRFHARNVYAVVMRTITRFEHALGRRVGWAFGGQQLKVAPHAFMGANAFYSREHQALLFGYFPGRKGGWVYTCLAHDVVVHETTHAILDGLRERFADLSHPDQAAFHEAFADIVALLSIFALRDVVETTLRRDGLVHKQNGLIDRSQLTVSKLAGSALLGLAKQLGSELSGSRGEVLRRSATLTPEVIAENQEEFEEPHRRGEILVAAMINVFLEAWQRRLERAGDGKGPLHVGQVVEEAAEVADLLLAVAIKALDYCPPVDVRFADYLSAMLTSDAQIRSDDTKYSVRDILRSVFRRYRILPAVGTDDGGAWLSYRGDHLFYDHSHIESMQRSPEEVFRFLWENRGELSITEQAYARVISVRPSIRLGSDGFFVRETVAEYKQSLDVFAASLDAHGVRRPKGMPDDFMLRLAGGGVLIFDEFGRLKYHIYQRLFGTRQSERLQCLWDDGVLPDVKPRPVDAPLPFAALHEARTASFTVRGGRS